MYVKFFGQEIAFAHIDKAIVDQIIEVPHHLLSTYSMIYFELKIENVLSHKLLCVYRWPLDLQFTLMAGGLWMLCCLVLHCTTLNHCWSLRSVAYFPLPLVCPWS